MKVTPKMALLTIVSSTIYFGLAVLCRGGFFAFTTHPALMALIVVTVVAVIAALFTEGNLNTGQQEDRSNRWVIPVLAILGFAGMIGAAYTDRIGFWCIDGDTARWIGVVLYAVGCFLRIWPVYILGRRFSGLVAIQENHELVTTGIYGIIRNPSYLGLMITAVGWALAFRSAVGLIFAALLFIPLVARMNAEEALLSGHFGAEYDGYRARVARLIPHVY